MELIKLTQNNIENIKESIVATIGQFDGLHKAHLALLEKTMCIAKEKNLKSALITFDPHPDFVLKKDLSNTYVTPLDEKILILNEIGLDYLIVIEFTKEVANIKPIDFVKNYLVKNNVQEVVVGFDFSFGKFGKGKANDISEMSKNKIKVNIIDEIKYNDKKIGTTLIKTLLKDGKVKTVKELLGRNYKISGQVVHGNHIGKTINLPTANLFVDEQFAYLCPGVYVVRVKIDGKRYFGFANLGNNPSFNYSKNMIFETHIFNFSKDIYDKIIEIELLEFIRSEKKFSSVNEFLDQIAKDKEFAKNFCKKFLD